MAKLPEQPIPYRNRLTVRLTGAVILALLLIGSPFLVAFHLMQRHRQVEALIDATDQVGSAVIDSLRAAMLAGTPHLLDDVVRGLSEQNGIERALLVGHRGRLRQIHDIDSTVTGSVDLALMLEDRVYGIV